MGIPNSFACDGGREERVVQGWEGKRKVHVDTSSESDWSTEVWKEQAEHTEGYIDGKLARKKGSGRLSWKEKRVVVN